MYLRADQGTENSGEKKNFQIEANNCKKRKEKVKDIHGT